MKKTCFFACIAADIAVFVIFIISMVSYFKENGLEIEHHLDYYSREFSKTLLYKLPFIILAIVGVIIIVMMFLKGHIVLKIVLALGLITSITGYVLKLLGSREIFDYIFLAGLAVCVVALLISGSTRKSAILWLLSAAWVKWIYIVFILLVVGTMTAIIILLCKKSDPIAVFDKYGKFVGYLYKD